MKALPWQKPDPAKYYFPLPNDIFRRELTACEFSIMAYLFSRAARKLDAPNLMTVRMNLGVSRNTMKKYVRRLQERDWIIVQHHRFSFPMFLSVRDTLHLTGALKRANGEGNIRKRKDGRWEGRFTAGYDPDTGKAILKNVLGRTQAEVREKLKEAIEKSGRVDMIRADRYTLGQWVTLWYDVYCKPNLRPSTARYYQMFIDKHIIPKLGKIKLSKLRAIEIQKFYNQLRTSGRLREAQKEKNPGLSPSYIRGIHTMLHTCLQAAVREKLLQYNPVDDCKPPKLVKKEMKTLEPEQVQAYLKAAEARGLLPMFFLELTTGMRKSELVALLWSDVDWKEQTISVSKQAYVTDGKLTAVPPKTANSIRKIALSQETLDLLRKQKIAFPDSDCIFPSPVTGEMYHPDSVVNLHKKILKEAGLEHIRFHDLRHTFATLALQNGVDVKTVSAMLGHSNAGFTLATYTHTTTAAQHQAAAIMGSLVSVGITPEQNHPAQNA